MKHLLWAACIMSGLVACTSNNKQPDKDIETNAPSPAKDQAAVKRKTIVFFGNSLTAAYQLSPEQGFTAIIQRKIDSLGLPYACVNAGLSGETTTDGVNRIDWVLQQPIDIFVLELGANDALRGLPVERSKQNLQTIIDRVKQQYPSAKIVLAGMEAPPNLGNVYTKAFHDIYPALAKTNNAVLIQFLLKDVGGIPALNIEDGIHPNPEGQKIVAETVWAIIKPIL